MITDHHLARCRSDLALPVEMPVALALRPGVALHLAVRPVPGNQGAAFGEHLASALGTRCPDSGFGLDARAVFGLRQKHARWLSPVPDEGARDPCFAIAGSDEARNGSASLSLGQAMRARHP